ncbi:glycosyltransferase family 4 protein [Nocardiopsis dassonvillei]|uniref:glycosyltransferase family 4 protein n=1 Tax=Nocardiopsis dassonvillei TaxID=2014 RepID=UPI0033E6C42F
MDTAPERLLVVGPTPLIDGISRFNRAMIQGLLERGHEVTTLDLEPHQPLEGVRDIKFPPLPPEMTTLDALEGFMLLNIEKSFGEFMATNNDWRPTGIILNAKARYVGPHMRDFFPEARLMQVGHNLAYYTEFPVAEGVWRAPRYQRGFSRTHRETDVSVGVGPLLSSDLLRVEARRVLEVAPPISTSSRADAARKRRADERAETPEKPVRFLMYGRLNDASKGMQVAIEAISSLKRRGYDNAKLTLLGLPEDQIPMMQRRMATEVGEGVVECHSYAHDDTVIQRERDRADVVLMPSIREPFGLVATEAAGEGIPFLAPEGSGVGLFLADPDRVPAHLAQDFIVRDEEHCRAVVDRTPPPDTPRGEVWAAAMADMIDHYPERLAQSVQLRDEHLAARYTETHLADAFVGALRHTEGRHIKQGPEGVLLAASDSRVLPVTTGPTIDTLDLPKDQQVMHHQALSTQTPPARSRRSRLGVAAAKIDEPPTPHEVNSPGDAVPEVTTASRRRMGLSAARLENPPPTTQPTDTPLTVQLPPQHNSQRRPGHGPQP